jgi:hypothetical protein
MIPVFAFVVFDGARVLKSSSIFNARILKWSDSLRERERKKLSDLNARPCDIEMENRSPRFWFRERNAAAPLIGQLTQFLRHYMVACAAFRRIVLASLCRKRRDVLDHFDTFTGSSRLYITHENWKTTPSHESNMGIPIPVHRDFLQKHVSHQNIFFK